MDTHISDFGETDDPGPTHSVVGSGRGTHDRIEAHPSVEDSVRDLNGDGVGRKTYVGSKKPSTKSRDSKGTHILCPSMI